MTDYATFIVDYVDRTEPHTVTATDAAAELLSLAYAGEPWAQSKVFEFVRAKMVDDVKSRRAESSRITYTDGAGRKRRVKTAVSRPVVDRNTGEVRDFQTVLEWDMEAAELNAVLADLQRSALEVGDRIAIVLAMLDALARHPECRTAGEAWVADGRDPAEIDLSA